MVSELLAVFAAPAEVAAKGGVAEKLTLSNLLLIAAASLGAVVVAWVSKRGLKLVSERIQAKKTLGPETLRPAGAPAEPDIPPRQLRRAWLRFLLRLPREYRRSILNFEHFILLGRAGSGKSRLLETQTDYRYQMRQVAGDAPIDPELPVVLASGAVIMELPARFLEDETLQGRVAIDRLWGPLYARRSPTVVLAVDVSWLTSATRDDLRELARCARSKVNLLSAIRKKPIELRIALTHLDALVGAHETMRFWSQVGVSASLRMPAEASIPEAITAWEREADAQLPRALSVCSADDYRNVLAFTRDLPRILAPLSFISDALFTSEPMSQTPLRGGVFFCSEPASTANPLRNAAEAGPGPSPLRRHLQLAIGAAAVCIAYMTLAYKVQERAWAPAADAIASYHVAMDLLGSDREREQRERIVDFTVKRTGLLYRFPDFHGSARRAMRARLSTELRQSLLVPRLLDVAQHGIPSADGMTLRWRRSIYFLALIHSFVEDRLSILPRMDRWQPMTALPSDIIRDYITNTDVALQSPISSFKLAADARDPRDRAAFWEDLPLETNKALEDKILRADELTKLQELAKPRHQSIRRFDHDKVTLEIFDNIDTAADLGGERHGNPAPRLREAYLPEFVDIFRDVGKAVLEQQQSEIERLLTLVHTASVAAPEETLVHDLADRLAVLKHGSSDADVRAIELKLDGKKYVVDVQKWNEALQDGRAAVLIDRFLAATANRESVFFTSSIDAELRSVVWNPLATEVSIFGGPARLAGRYTKVAFTNHVKKEVERLVDVVDALHVPAGHRERLFRQIEHDVASYASRFHSEASRFLHSYRVRADSAEALRVALGEIARDRSTFDDFVLALADNTWFGDEPASPKAAAPAADPKAANAGKPAADAKAAELGHQNEARRLLTPFYDEFAAFASWHAVADDAELKKYKEIAKQLLTDLSGSDAGGGDKKAAPEKDPGLSGALSPAGKVTLASLNEAKGSYLGLVRDWVTGAGLSAEHEAPFLMPFQELSSIGQTDIEAVIARSWEDELVPLVRALSAKFPFNRSAQESASPEEVSALFHPQEGRLFALSRAYVDPVTPDAGRGSAARVRLPADLKATLNSGRLLSQRLWDEKGTPRKLEFQVTPVPFQAGSSGKLVPTMVYLNVGEQSVFNFNQAPQAARVTFDWTHDEPVQLGLQVTDSSTSEQSFPAPVVVEGPFWRVFRLLVKGSTTRVRAPIEGELHEWQLGVDGSRGLTVRASFVVHGDPWQGFNLPRVASSSGRTLR
ncbi:MAG: type VI secretion protein IcmF/TssM N-terminal domain-containing protein [Myxococcota bacterium]